MTIDHYISAHDAPPPSLRLTGHEPQGRPMGTQAQMRAALSALAPGIDWADPEWGWLEHGDATAQFAIGGGDPCTSIGVFIRFPGDWSERLFADLRSTYPDWYVFDAFHGEWAHQL